MPRKKKADLCYKVEKMRNSSDKDWIRMKGQFLTQEDANAWIESKDDDVELYRIMEEDKL